MGRVHGYMHPDNVECREMQYVLVCSASDFTCMFYAFSQGGGSRAAEEQLLQ